MFGLILKDLKNVRGQILYYLIVFAVLAAVSIATNNVYFMGGVSFLGVALPLSAISIDEKDGWDTFALASGITRFQLVMSRYLLAIASFVIVLAVSFLLAAAGRLLDRGAVVALLSFAGIGFLAADVMYPFIFKLGTEQARVVYLVFIAVGVLLGASVAVVIEMAEWANDLMLYLPMALGIAGLVPSILISNHLYKIKNF